jgi:hypothetical protein
MTTNSFFDGPFIAVPAWAVEVLRKDGHPRDFQVLVGLVGCMDLRTRTVQASLIQVAEYIGVSRETVKRAVHDLERLGIISVSRTANSVNSYTIHYTRVRGVTADPAGGHGRPPRVVTRSTSGEGRGVTGDPAKSTISPAQDGDSNKTDIYSNRAIPFKKEEVPCGDEGANMILGGDPEDEKPEPPAKPKRKRAPSDIHSLSTEFLYHPKSRATSSTYTPKDRIVIHGAIKKLLASGLTRQTVIRMIDRFWSNPTLATHDNPVNSFASRVVQQSLMADVPVQVEGKNPVLDMIGNGFSRADEELPWPAEADDELQKAVLIHGMEVAYRYPEIVADLAVLWNGDFKNWEFIRSLENLNLLVLWHSGNASIDDVGETIDSLSSLSLPSELLKREPSVLRPPAGTIGEAVYNYRRFGGGTG